MTKTRFPTKAALALALPLTMAATAAPLLGPGAMFGGETDETTVRIVESKNVEPIVLSLSDLKDGERKTFTSSTGKAIEVTRTPTGATIRIDGKETKIRLDGEGPGETEDGLAGKVIVVTDDEDGDVGPGEAKRVVRLHGTGGDMKVFVRRGGFGFRTGGSPEMDVKSLMEKGDLESLRGLDAQTRESVQKVLTELAGKGVLLPHAVGLLHMEGDGPRVIVERKKTSTR